MSFHVFDFLATDFAFGGGGVDHHVGVEAGGAVEALAADVAEAAVFGGFVAVGGGT